MLQCARQMFVDLRVITVLMTLWLGVVILIMVEIGIFSNSKFVAFGPRKELTFMHVSVDTQYKYGMLVAMIVIHTLISDLVGDSINPQIINALQNTSTRFIPHKTYIYYIVTTVYAIYCSISQVFVIFIAFAQLDLLIVRLASDMLANLITTTLYLHDKVYDPRKFEVVFDECELSAPPFADDAA